MKSAWAFLCLLSLALSEPIPQQPPPEILRTLQLPPLPSPEDRSLSSDRATLLNDHNDYRRAHNVPTLQMDSGLEDMAQKWAEELARTERIAHSPKPRIMYGKKVGENVYEGGNALEASKLWYCEVDDYKKNPNVWARNPDIGHFTQLVWKDSTKVGFGIATTSNGRKTYVVANYWPAGNMNFNTGGARANVINYESATCKVSCGGHDASSCSQCPIDQSGHNHGRSWCNGDCQWRNNRCT